MGRSFAVLPDNSSYCRINRPPVEGLGPDAGLRLQCLNVICTLLNFYEKRERQAKKLWQPTITIINCRLKIRDQLLLSIRAARAETARGQGCHAAIHGRR
jgi:hypothetical protein